MTEAPRQTALSRVPARRSVLLPALITLGILAILLALGAWQLQRRTEKHALMAALDERLHAAPVPLPQPAEWPLLTRERDEFRRVTFTAAFRAVPDARVYSSGSALRADVAGTGAFVFHPVAVGGKTVVVDRGFVPEGAAVEQAPAAPTAFTGYLRFPEQVGWITPAPNLTHRLWFVRDPEGMASALGWGEVAPFYVALEAPAPPSGRPKPGPLAAGLKDNHLPYAITWFGLALAVAIAFLFWLRGARRTAPLP